MKTDPEVTATDTMELSEVLSFMRVMWQLDHALQRSSKRMGGAIGVTGPQRLALRIIGRFPGATAGDVARILHVHPSTLTGIFKRLELRGLLRRCVDGRDRRRVVLSLTEKGRRIDVNTSGTIEEAVEAVLADAPRGQIAHARRVLERIAERLDNGGGKS